LLVTCARTHQNSHIKNSARCASTTTHHHHHPLQARRPQLRRPVRHLPTLHPALRHRRRRPHRLLRRTFRIPTKRTASLECLLRSQCLVHLHIFSVSSVSMQATQRSEPASARIFNSCLLCGQTQVNSKLQALICVFHNIKQQIY